MTSTATTGRVGVRYRATPDGHGTYTVHDVPIFGFLPKDERGNPDDIDREWMLEAIERAQRLEAKGHLAPVHFAHPGGGSQRICSFMPTRVGELDLGDGPIDVLFADLREVPGDVLAAFERLEMPHRSVEVRDWGQPFVNALGLLSGDPPYFPFPRMIGCQVEGEEPIGTAPMPFASGYVACLAASRKTRHLSAVFNFRDYDRKGGKLGADGPREKWSWAPKPQRATLLRDLGKSDEEVEKLKYYNWSNLDKDLQRAIYRAMLKRDWVEEGDWFSALGANPFAKKDDPDGDGDDDSSREGDADQDGGKASASDDAGQDDPDAAEGPSRVERMMGQLMTLVTRVLEAVRGTDEDAARQPARDQDPDPDAKEQADRAAAADEGKSKTEGDEDKDRKEAKKESTMGANDGAKMTADAIAELSALKEKHATLQSDHAKLTARCDQLEAKEREREASAKLDAKIADGEKRLRARRVVLPTDFAAKCRKFGAAGLELVDDYIGTLEATGRTDPPETFGHALDAAAGNDEECVAKLGTQGVSVLEAARKRQAEWRLYRQRCPETTTTCEEFLRAGGFKV